jgi:magnesium-transporting ATPase (P-type)
LSALIIPVNLIVPIIAIIPITRSGIPIAGALIPTCVSERLVRSITEPNVEDDCVRGVALVMAACHSLRYLITSSPDHSNDSLKEPELIGDPLEAVMLAECGWRMVTTADRVDMLSPVGEAVTVSIIAAFDFSADLARMSTIVRVGHKDGSAPQYMVLVKGSPESVARCSRANTVPEDFEKQVPFIRTIGNLGFIIGAVCLAVPEPPAPVSEPSFARCR